MSSRTHATPTSDVSDGRLDLKSLPPPIQYRRARASKSAQMPGYLSDVEDTKEINDVREHEASPVSPRIDSLSGNTQASSGHDPQENAQPSPATSMFEDSDENIVQFDPYDKVKAKWKHARNTQSQENAKPPTETSNPWKSCLDHLVKRDKTACDSWSEDIDSILIFAGLFSAVVTAFAIDSYKWLDADPADTTNMILQHISGQLAGTQRLEYVPAPFTVTSSVRRINVCWFLSLVFALTTAVLGILCKQWVREHRQELPARSYQEQISLRQMRFESLRYWKVEGIVATLPLQLQIAFVFFFIGLVDLLWTRDRILAVLISVLGLFTVMIIIITTVLPAAIFLYHTKGNPEGYLTERADILPCAFKSMQSWLFLKVVLGVQRFIHNISSLVPRQSRHNIISRIGSKSSASDTNTTYNWLESWTSSDLPIIARPPGAVPNTTTTSFGRYLCSGLGWIDKHISNKEMAPDLHHCLDRMDIKYFESSRFSNSGGKLTWMTVDLPDDAYEEEDRQKRLDKDEKLIQIFSQNLSYGHSPLVMEQLILCRIDRVKYYIETAEYGKKPASAKVWNSSIFKMMVLGKEADWSPPFLCALIAHIIRLSTSFPRLDGYGYEYEYEDEERYTENVEVIWICWLVQDSLDYRELQNLDDNDTVVRYLMEEGILRTLNRVTGGDDEERRAFISRCEPDEDGISYGSIRGVVYFLERRRLQLGIKASDSWNGLVDDLKLVEET